MTVEAILADFPQLAQDDIRQALRYAAAAVDERELPLASAGWGSFVDESISARVARLLNEARHDAVHVADLNLLGAVDDIVMDAARAGDRILLTADSDFGGLLALGNHIGPSVVIFRRTPHSPERQARLLLGGLPHIGENLSLGAVVVLGPDRARIRRLPMGTDE